MEPLFSDAKGREIVPPDLGGAPVADTHAHLDMLDDPALALARAGAAGVRFIAAVTDVSEDAWRTYDSLESWLENARELSEAPMELPEVRVIVGCHPHNAKAWGPEAENELRQLAAHPLTCGIGEVGLDYHYDHSPRETQREAMRVHLALAREFGLPCAMHLREAHADGLAILREVGMPPAGAILHCHTLGPEDMAPFVESGCHVSFAGPVTFKKAEEIRSAAVAVPADRLLTETDCPFMSPEPFRGRTNEPANVVFTAARIAEARGEEIAVFARRSYESAVALLGGEGL